MNEFMKKLLGLISQHENVTIEEMNAYLLELKRQGAKIEKLTLDKLSLVEVKANDGGLKIKVIASTPSIDRGNDIVVPEGITTPNLKGGILPMLHQHDDGQVIGHWSKWYIEDNKFMMEGEVYAPITEWQKDVYSRIEKGVLNGISIGFIGLEVSILENEIRRFDKIELLEASVVTIPMNQDAHIVSVEKVGESAPPSDQGGANEQPSPDAQKTAKSVNGEGEGAAPATPESPDNSTEKKPTESEDALSALKEELGKVSENLAKVTSENEQLKEKVAALEAELNEAETLMGEAAEQVEELQKMRSKS